MALQPLSGLGLIHKTPPFIPICSFTPPSSYAQQLSSISLNHIRPSSSWSSHWSRSRKFPFKTFFGILCSSILIICLAHSNLLKLMSYTMFGSLYRV